MNKKIIAVSSIIGIIVIGVIVFLVTRGNSSSVVGEWVIDSYNTANGNIKQENIGEYYGENYQNANAEFSAVFDDNGTVILNMPVYEGMEPVSKEIPYEIKGSEIYLSAEGESIKGFEIKGDTLIMYDIGNIMDEAVLKKK
ncbi:MAG: hypothetical protein HFJ57_07920 [Clostridia bacterium]|jgi:hypothetical protein|nr:hypothetical protein [Clostridia bacterium]